MYKQPVFLCFEYISSTSYFEMYMAHLLTVTLYLVCNSQDEQCHMHIQLPVIIALWSELVHLSMGDNNVWHPLTKTDTIVYWCFTVLKDSGTTSWRHDYFFSQLYAHFAAVYFHSHITASMSCDQKRVTHPGLEKYAKWPGILFVFVWERSMKPLFEDKKRWDNSTAPEGFSVMVWH